jgi:hypothetical protein
MLNHLLAFAGALLLTVTTVRARRVALVIGQNAYPRGASATVGLRRSIMRGGRCRSLAPYRSHGLERHLNSIILVAGNRPFRAKRARKRLGSRHSNGYGIDVRDAIRVSP